MKDENLLDYMHVASKPAFRLHPSSFRLALHTNIARTTDDAPHARANCNRRTPEVAWRLRARLHLIHSTRAIVSFCIAGTYLEVENRYMSSESRFIENEFEIERRSAVISRVLVKD